MVLCIADLSNGLGYNVVRLPRKGIDPLDVLGQEGKSIERLGRLDQLWASRKPVPSIGAPQPAAHISGHLNIERLVTAASYMSSWRACAG
jgi:hypothetical protein